MYLLKHLECKTCPHSRIWAALMPGRCTGNFKRGYTHRQIKKKYIQDLDDHHKRNSYSIRKSISVNNSKFNSQRSSIIKNTLLDNLKR